MENASRELEEIAKELVKVIGSREAEDEESIQFGASKFNIYRYHRANIIDRSSSVFGETILQSGPYALSLHLFLEPSEFCLHSDSGSGLGFLSFETKPNTLVVTMGKELEVRLAS